MGCTVCVFRVRKSPPLHLESYTRSKKPLWPSGQNCLDIWRFGDVCSCHRLASADWAVKTGKRRGAFSHHGESRLGKTCLMGAYKVFLGLSGETLEEVRSVKHRTLGSLSSQAVRKRKRVEDLLAQRVGPCFTLNGHTAAGLTQTVGCLLKVWDGAFATRQPARSSVDMGNLSACVVQKCSLQASD